MAEKYKPFEGDFGMSFVWINAEDGKINMIVEDESCAEVYLSPDDARQIIKELTRAIEHVEREA